MKSAIKQFFLVAIVVVGILGYMVGGAVEKRSAPDLVGVNDVKIAYWVAPMDPNYRRDEPGKSPMGMDLVPVYEGEADKSGVRISPSTINNLGIRTARVLRKDLVYQIETVGFVGYDERHVSHVHMRTEGWIDELLAKVEGERVKRGDLLFRIYAPDLVVAQSEYLQALKSGDKVHIALTDERLRLLGFHKRQIIELQATRKLKQLVDVYADQDGVVTELNVAEKMFVTPGTSILTIADLSSVWVLADVFEEQSGWLAEGLDAQVETSFQSGSDLKGTVDYVYPTIDPLTRTIKVRLKFDNAGEVLKPNMYTKVWINAEARKDVLTIPQDALIRTAGSDRVIVSLGEGRFEPREVEVGLSSGREKEVLSGISEGDEIVVSGQFLIDSEASMSASLRRMSDPASMPAKTPDAMEMDDNKPDVILSIRAVGTVDRVMAGHGMLTITHEPIPDIGWPVMTMDFQAGAEVDLSLLRVGDRIHFELARNDGGTYVVTAIHVMNQ
jgi:Cu(I)/Ag(I) efflux system membrane fusion protein